MTKGLKRSAKKAQRRTQMVPIRALQIAITDPGSANAPFTAVVGGLPRGYIQFEGATASLQLTKVSGGLTDTFTGNIAAGTTPTADATLDGTDVNILPSTAITAASAGVSAAKRYSNVTPLLLDNSDGSLEINLNGFIADAAISADGVLQVDGFIEVAYTVKA
jgi:hypothetical protein